MRGEWRRPNVAENHNQWETQERLSSDADSTHGNRNYKVYTVYTVFKGHLNIPENVSRHGRCPFVTGSWTWGRHDTVLRYRTPSWDTGHRPEITSPDQREFSHESPLQTGCTVPTAVTGKYMISAPCLGGRDYYIKSLSYLLHTNWMWNGTPSLISRRTHLPLYLFISQSGAHNTVRIESKCHYSPRLL